MKKPAAPKTETPHSLDEVVAAIVHRNTAAIIFEHLSEYTADAFRGSESRGPKKLLALANGTRCRAEVADVLAVERVLRDLATDARKKVAALKRALVLVDPAAVAPTEVSSEPVAPPPPGEWVVDAAVPKPVAGGSTRK